MKLTQIFPAALAAVLFTTSCGGGATPPPATPTTPEATATQSTAPAPAPAAKPPEGRLPDTAAPLTYILNFTLDPSKATFTGDTRINIALTEPTDHLWLNGKDLTVTSATLETNTEQLPATPIAEADEDHVGFTFPKEVGPGQVWLEIAYTGKVSDKDWTGLFREQYGPKGHEDWYLYSQGEAVGARRIFPSFDEPKWKVPFTISLTVPKELAAFSNAPQKSVTAGPADGMKTVVFETTKPLPSYLVALAVGPFEIVDVGPVGRNKTPVRIITTKGDTGKVAFAKTVVTETLKRLEDYFDLGYPYPKLDHIVVPHFLGAMENPGLITYDAAALLAEPGNESRAFKRGTASVVAHESAHQWFGDLVTLAWWNDIWLNESFATWMSAKIVNEWHPEWGGLDEAVARKGGVMSQDSLSTSSPIRRPVKSGSDLEDFADLGLVYGKGAAVLWMFEQAVGPDKFQHGVHDYLEAHEWKTATAPDFLSAIAKVSDPAIPAAFSTFLDQPGVPMVSAALSCKKGAAPSLALSQKRYLPAGSKGSSDETWDIPICVKYPVGRKVSRTCTMLSKKEDSLALPDAKRCPAWVLANADGAGYYRVAYQGKLLHDLLGKGKKQLSVAEQIDVIDDLQALVAANQVDVGDALAALPSLAKSKNRHVVDSAIGIMRILHEPFVPEKLKPNRARFVRKIFGARARRLGWTPRKGEDDNTKMLRSEVVPLVAYFGQDETLRKQAMALTQKWLKTGKGIDDDDLPKVIGTAALDGDMKLRNAVLAKAKAETDRGRRHALFAAVGMFRKPEIVKANLALFLSDKDVDLRSGFSIIRGAMRDPESREVTYQFIKDNFQAILDKLPKMFRGYIFALGGEFCDEAHYKDFDTYFRPFAKKESGGEKVLDEALERVQLCIARVNAQQPEVEAFLKKQ